MADKKQDLQEIHKIYSRDKKKGYTLESLKMLYIVSDESPIKFANRYDLPTESVTKLVKQENWDELRKKNERQAKLELMRVSELDLTDSLDLELQVRAIEKMKLRGEIEFLARYYQEHGDLYARHPESNEILRDAKGQPISLRTPGEMKDVNKRKASLEIVQGLRTLVNESEQKRLEEADSSGSDAIELSSIDIDKLYEAAGESEDSDE